MRDWLRRAAGLMCLVGGTTVSLHAQTSPLTPICPAGRQPILDTTTVTLALDAVRPYRDSVYTAAARQQVLYYADAMRRHFVPPTSLGDLPPLVLVPFQHASGHDDGTSSLVSGRLILIVKREGHTRTVAWESFPLAASLSSAIVKAVRAAEAARDFDGIMRATDSSDDDTLAVDIVALRETATPQIPLMRAQLIGYIPEAPAMASLPGRMEYPQAARQRGVGTEGAVRFVVGTDGHAVSSTIQVTKSGWRDFVLPMTRAVERSVYIAAKSGGCAVPSLERQSYRYEIQR